MNLDKIVENIEISKIVISNTTKIPNKPGDDKILSFLRNCYKGNKKNESLILVGLLNASYTQRRIFSVITRGSLIDMAKDDKNAKYTVNTRNYKNVLRIICNSGLFKRHTDNLYELTEPTILEALVSEGVNPTEQLDECYAFLAKDPRKQPEKVSTKDATAQDTPKTSRDDWWLYRMQEYANLLDGTAMYDTGFKYNSNERYQTFKFLKPLKALIERFAVLKCDSNGVLNADSIAIAKVQFLEALNTIRKNRFNDKQISADYRFNGKHSLDLLTAAKQAFDTHIIPIQNTAIVDTPDMPPIKDLADHEFMAQLAALDSETDKNTTMQAFEMEPELTQS